MRLLCPVIALIAIAMTAACGGDKPRPGADASRDASAAGTAATTPASIPDDWVTFSPDGISLSLPPGFDGGPALDQADALIARLEQQYPDCKPALDPIATLAHSYVFLALDGARCASKSVANVSIAKEQSQTDISALDYLNAAEQFLPRTFDVQRKEPFDIPDYDAARMLVHIDGTAASEEFYTIRDGDTYWSVVFAATGDRFEALLEDSELTIRSLSIEP